MDIINTVFPVFLVIALGAILRRRHFISADLVAGLNRLVYWVALPTLLFYKIATANYDYGTVGKTFFVMLAGTLASIAAAYVIAVVMKIPTASIGTFVQGSFRSNLLYVGLPIVIYSFSDSANFGSDKAATLAIVVMAPLVPIYNIAAVLVLLAGRHKLDRSVPGKIFRRIITNPILLACVTGALYQLIFPPLPKVIVRACSAVGQIALPSALLGIGATLATGKIAGRRTYALTSSLIKVLLAPLAGLLAALLLALGPAETRVALILLACPAATVSYIMAEQLGGDDKLAASIVLISTILSIISLSLVVAVF